MNCAAQTYMRNVVTIMYQFHKFQLFPLFNQKGYSMKKILIASAILCFASAQAFAQSAPAPAAAAPATGTAAAGAAAGTTVAGLSVSTLIAIGAAVAVVAGAASSDSTTAHATPSHH